MLHILFDGQVAMLIGGQIGLGKKKQNKMLRQRSRFKQARTVTEHTLTGRQISNKQTYKGTDSHAR